jgi:hypothetical protein
LGGHEGGHLVGGVLLAPEHRGIEQVEQGMPRLMQHVGGEQSGHQLVLGDRDRRVQLGLVLRQQMGLLGRIGSKRIAHIHPASSEL